MGSCLQVRSLAATPWQREEPAFASYAAAAADLAHASIAAFDKKPSKASLSSVRLILRSIAKQARATTLLTIINSTCIPAWWLVDNV